MMMRTRSLLLLALAAAPGCFWTTTKSEGQALRRDVDSLETRVSTKEAELAGKVDELQKTLDEAAQVLKRNSADLGAEVQRIDEEQRKVLGLVTAAQANAEEVRQGLEQYKAANDARLTALEGRVSALEGKKPGGPSADELWRQGSTAFGAKKWGDAREAYKKLVTDYPTHERADDAQYFRAETHYAEKEWDAAIREYQKVFDKYADSSLADDALFRAGEAAEQLKNCTEARAYFGQLKQKYPSSNLAKRAGDKDKALKSAAKNKKKCRS